LSADDRSSKEGEKSILPLTFGRQELGEKGALGLVGEKAEGLKGRPRAGGGSGWWW
jgi:hypothetical protein